LAAGAKPKGAPEDDGHVDVSPFAAPVIIDGRVVNYVFVSVRLHTAPGVDRDTLKRGEPRLREAMVRAAHRTALNPAGDRSTVDEARLAKLALAEAGRVAGPKAYTRAEVRKQTPQRRLPAVGSPG
jgi:hypothetical protein